jgi:hypothetical protein
MGSTPSSTKVVYDFFLYDEIIVFYTVIVKEKVDFNPNLTSTP